MFAKLIDGKLQVFDGMIKQGSTVISCTENAVELLKENGFKKVTNTPCPEKDGFYFTSGWTEKKNEIVQVWTEHKIETVDQSEKVPSTNEPDMALSARITALEQKNEDLQAKVDFLEIMSDTENLEKEIYELKSLESKVEELQENTEKSQADIEYIKIMSGLDE